MEDSSELFVTEKNMLEYVMGIGRNLMNKIFEEMGTGYEGNRIEKDGNKYEFKGNRKNSIHGLFGSIDYKRAYYVGANNTGWEAYQESLNRFHEIFRPAGKDLISLGKTLDMDYELGGRLEGIRQEEIDGVYDEGEEIEKEDVIGVVRTYRMGE